MKQKTLRELIAPVDQHLYGRIEIEDLVLEIDQMEDAYAMVANGSLRVSYDVDDIRDSFETMAKQLHRFMISGLTLRSLLHVLHGTCKDRLMDIVFKKTSEIKVGVDTHHRTNAFSENCEYTITRADPITGTVALTRHDGPIESTIFTNIATIQAEKFQRKVTLEYDESYGVGEEASEKEGEGPIF